MDRFHYAFLFFFLDWFGIRGSASASALMGYIEYLIMIASITVGNGVAAGTAAARV